MENLLTLQPRTVLRHDESLQVFFKDNLEPLIKKFKYRLSQFEIAVVSSENYTLSKINDAYHLLERLGQEWERALEATQHDCVLASPDLMSAMSELSKKYHELEDLNNSERLENAIDAFMIKIEELDGKISDALGRADKMRERMEEKFHEVAEVANEQIDKLKEAMTFGTKRLLHYDELPAPWQSNKTGNIWTHLLGFICLLSIGIYELFYSDLITNVPITDRLVFLIFLLAACKCLMCSTVWHTLSGINNLKIYKQVACLDYVGISVLICASIMLCEYYAFYCDDAIRNAYMVATSSLAILGVIMPFQSWFDHHDRRWLRIAFFIALASSSAIIIIHTSLVRGVFQTFGWLTPVFKSLGCYVAGVIIYGNQFPEKFWPGRFDRLGHSHQFWHLFVCGGIWYHYQAALQFASFREEFAQCSA
ncbi:hypothetical protein G6F43_009195 [Rhizopus delemar]|nr:hypothetical protein G6F43_009195 [Rhizopus delemar]